MDKLKNIHLSNYEKIGVVWGIMVILLIAALGLRFLNSGKVEERKTVPPIKVVVTIIPLSQGAKQAEGRLLFTEVPKVLKNGGVYEIGVDIEAPGKQLDGSDVYVLYDPKYIMVEKVTESDYFSTVPVKEIDNQKGLVRVTAFQPKDSKKISASVKFFTLSFQTKKTGTADFKFAYEKDRTNLSTLVEKGTSKNILGEAGSTKLVIE